MPKEKAVYQQSLTLMSVFFLIKIEEEELEEFELLEQAAANASFSSNSSVVVKVLAKARDKAQDGKHVCQGQSVTNNRGTECLAI